MLRPNYRIFPSIFAVILWGLWSPLFAADSTFRVDSYIPERFVDLSWRIIGAGNLMGDDDDQYSIDYSSGGDNYSDNNQGGSLSLTSPFSYTYETKPLRFEIGLIGSISHDKSVDKHKSWPEYDDSEFRYYNDRKIDQNNFRTGLGLGVESVIYFSETQYLICGLGLESQYSRGRGNFIANAYTIEEYPDHDDAFYRETEQRDESELDERRYYGQLNIGWGMGRKHDGRSSITALNIITELRKMGLLIKEPDFDQMYILSDRLYKYRQEHKIDERWHRIESLSDITRYLKENRIIVEESAPIVLIIQDIWDYFPKNPTNYGIKSELGLGFDNVLTRHRQESRDQFRELDIFTDSAGVIDTTNQDEYLTFVKEYTESSNYSVSSYWNIEMIKPLWPRWISINNFNMKYVIHSRSVEDYSYNRLLPSKSGYRQEYVRANRDYLTLDHFSQIRFLYDSRTEGGVSILLSYKSYKTETYSRRLAPYAGEKENQSKSKDHHLRINSGISFTYRIKPPTTIYVDLMYLYDRDFSQVENNNEERSNSGLFIFNLEISHYIL